MQLVLFLSSLLAVYGDCISDPTDTKCANYEFPLDLISKNLTELCASMSNMPGCSVKNLCESQPSLSSKPYCNTISLYSDICVTDMPGMEGCKDFTSACGNSKTEIKQCSIFKPLNNIPTYDQARANIKSICDEMTMVGCEKCAGSKINKCDYLPVYSQLCKAMPTMKQCKEWKAFCPGSEDGVQQVDIDYCSVDSVDSPPQMRMYFHTGLRDYILFQSWVPNTGLQYAGSVIAIIVMGILYELILTIRGHLEQGWTAKSSSKVTEYSIQQFKIDSMRAGFQFVESTIAYLLMLISMTFNVGLFFSVIAGIGLGTLMFARFRAYGSTKRPCGC